MSDIDNRLQFIKLYRKQLKNDLDAMGYGQRQHYIADGQTEVANWPSTTLAIIAATFMALGFVAIQMI